MPVRARSRSSISAITCLPERLMSRSSSSSGSTPSRMKPPSRANAGGSSTSVRSMQVAHVGEVVELREQAAEQRRLHVVEQQPHARDRRERLPQRHEIARTGGAERGAARPAARGRGRPSAPRGTCRARCARNASSSTASSRSWMRSSATSGRSSQARSSRPPIDVTVRSIS